MGSAIRPSLRAWPSGPGRAATPAGPARADGADLCPATARAAPRRSGVRSDVLPAIAPTGPRRGRPWTVALDGPGCGLATRDGAVGLAENALAQGRTSLGAGGVRVSWRRHGESAVPVAPAPAEAPAPRADASRRLRGSPRLGSLGPLGG